MDLKILTKTLANRLHKVLYKIIDLSQTCLKGRQIFTYLHIIQDLIDLCNNNKKELALLFLDQEKAFDRMSHSFILKSLEKFGFGYNFITWIKIIYSNCISRVMVNGYTTAFFRVALNVST